MKCGNCHQAHETVQDVRNCYGIATAVHSNGQVTGPGHGVNRPNTASGKQLEYIADLELARGLSPHRGTLTLQEASDLITELKAMPIPKQPVPASASPHRSHPDVPAGHYAIPSLTGNNDLDFFRVDRPTEGKWAGRTFVKRVIGGRPSSPVRGQTARQALELIAAQPEKSALLYAQELGRCSRCNRHLTDELSRRCGMGPECRSR